MKIDVSTFVEEEIDRLRIFKEWWMDKNKIDKKNYPSKLNYVDWEEQYLFFTDADGTGGVEL